MGLSINYVRVEHLRSKYYLYLQSIKYKMLFHCKLQRSTYILFSTFCGMFLLLLKPQYSLSSFFFFYLKVKLFISICEYILCISKIHAWRSFHHKNPLDKKTRLVPRLPREISVMPN